MLKQLLKYEFKATGRTYGGLYLALVALAVLSGFSLRSSSKDDFASLLLFAYMVVAVAVAVVSVMTIVTRFTRNLLGREGYLMHTLPVTESQLILSKLISSVVWMLCSSIVGIFSFAVMLLALSLNSAALQQLPELWQKVVEIFREIFRMTGSSGWLWLIFETLNGLLVAHMGHIPQEGDTFDMDYGGYNFKVMSVENKVIKTVLVTKLDTKQEENEEKGEQ